MINTILAITNRLTTQNSTLNPGYYTSWANPYPFSTALQSLAH